MSGGKGYDDAVRHIALYDHMTSRLDSVLSPREQSERRRGMVEIVAFLFEVEQSRVELDVVAERTIQDGDEERPLFN